ncbi:uncharacterized protein ACR2FA_007321 [Aphomia sociella]
MFQSQEICRLCLREDDLGPIFLDIDRSKRYTIVLSLTTGLKIEPNDGLPQNICENCTNLVNSALRLRNMSHLNDRNSLEDYDDNNEIKEFNVEVEFDRLADENQNGVSNNDVKDIQTVQPNAKKEVADKITRNKKRAMYLKLVDGVLDPNGPVKCKVCKKTVSKWSCFISHAKLHLGFKFMCEFCGKSFISSTQLKRHCRSYHGMRRELPCKYCGFLALDNAQLLLHVRRMHTGERPYICDTCGAAYHSRKCLLQHLESHREIGTVRCTECDQLFKSRRHLARHRYSAHARSRATCPYPQCGRAYSRKYLRAHIAKHHPVMLADVDQVSGQDYDQN